MSGEGPTLRIYRRLAGAFPEEFRAEYGDGLDAAAEDMIRDAASRGGLTGLLRLVPMLLADLIGRLAAEHARDAVRDLRYGLRMLAAAPGFTAAAIVCLALGTGLASAMYGQIQATVFRAVPGIDDPGSLVRLQRPISHTYVEALRDTGVFAEVAAYHGPAPFVLERPDGARERVWGQLATPDYFGVLGARPFIGRVFGADERTPGTARSVVLSHRLWQGRFGADPGAVGRTIRVNGQAVTILGVAAPGFLGASPTTAAADLWMPTTAPIEAAPELRQLEAPLAAAFELLGRLEAGRESAEAEQMLDARIRQLEAAYGDPGRDSGEVRARLLNGGRMMPLRDEDLPKAIGLPLLLASLVLLMACASVATMVLARSAARRREFAVRLSLGAGPGRVLRQLATESLLLTLLGTAASVPVALGLLAYFAAVTPLLPGYGHFEARLDWGAVGLCGLLAAAFTVLFGLAPARRAGRGDISAGLKPHSASAPSGRRRVTLRNLLVFQQVAISVLLLLLTSFVVVGWHRSAGVDVGYRPEGLHLARLDPVRDGLGPEGARMVIERLVTSLGSTPGIGDVAIAQSLPPAMSMRDAMLSTKADFISGAGALGAVRVDRVGAGFFAAIGTRVLAGREFTAADEADEARVLVVNRVLASRLAPQGDPVGQTMEIDEAAWTIVGVVADIRSAFPLAQTPPQAFRPASPEGFASPARDGVSVLVRAAPGVDAALLVRDLTAGIDPAATVFEVTRASDELAVAAFLARFATTTYGGMGVFGLILAVVGLAGVTARAVAERRHEIGIRVALGATRGRVLWLVTRDSVAIIGVGTMAGLLAAVSLAFVLASVVDAFAETTATSLGDPVLLAGGPVLLALLALLACYLPARASTRIAPTEALRAE